MNKPILFALAVTQPADSLDTSKNKELFNKNVDSFKKKFVAGFKSEDQGLMMSL